jgi:hypothetical protein
VTCHSLEIIWETALEQANEKMAVHTGDERVKVILQQEAVGWSDGWSVAYTLVFCQPFKSCTAYSWLQQIIEILLSAHCLQKIRYFCYVAVFFIKFKM